MDPFASHVIRALLLLLCPNVPIADEGALRSKKSASWKARQGPMKSVFQEGKGKGRENASPNTPEQFHEAARTLVEVLREELDDNEVRALAANKVASPTLQVNTSQCCLETSSTIL